MLLTLREALWRAHDDAKDFVELLNGAKYSVLLSKDPRFELRTAEAKLNKIIENFNIIIKEIDNHNAKENT